MLSVTFSVVYNKANLVIAKIIYPLLISHVSNFVADDLARCKMLC